MIDARAFVDEFVAAIRAVSDGSTIAVEVVMRAVDDGPLELGNGEALPATGRRVEIPTAWFLELNEHGKIVRERDYFDTAAMLRQLGVG